MSSRFDTIPTPYLAYDISNVFFKLATNLPSEKYFQGNSLILEKI